MENQMTPPPPKNLQNPQQPAAGRMSEMDIISKNAAGKVDPKNLYASLSHAVQTNPNLRIMRANNTLFVYFNKGNGSVDVTMETADDPRKVVDSIKQFGQAMKKANFKTLKFQIENPDIVRAIKMAGFEPTLSGVAGQKMTGIVEV